MAKTTRLETLYERACDYIDECSIDEGRLAVKMFGGMLNRRERKEKELKKPATAESPAATQTEGKGETPNGGNGEPTTT